MTYTWTYRLDAERGILGWIAGANPDGELSHSRPPPEPLSDHGVPRYALTPEGDVVPSGRAPTPDDVAKLEAKESDQTARTVIRENLVDLVARAAKGDDVRAEIDRILSGGK